MYCTKYAHHRLLCGHSFSYLSVSPSSNPSTSIMTTPPPPPNISQRLSTTCPSSHFMLSSPELTIPDNFQLSEPSRTAIDMPISSTPVKDMGKSRVLPPSFFPNNKEKTLYSPLPTTASRGPSLPTRPLQPFRRYPEFPPIQDIRRRDEPCVDVSSHIAPMPIPSPPFGRFQDADRLLSGANSNHYQDDSTVIYCEDDLNDSVIICEDLSVAAHSIPPTFKTTVPDTPPKLPSAPESPLMFEPLAIIENNPIVKTDPGRSDSLVALRNGVGGEDKVSGSDECIYHSAAVGHAMQETSQIGELPDVIMATGNGVEAKFEHLDVRSPMHYMDRTIGEDSATLPQRRSKRLNTRKSATKSVRTLCKSKKVNDDLFVLYMSTLRLQYL